MESILNICVDDLVKRKYPNSADLVTSLTKRKICRRDQIEVIRNYPHLIFIDNLLEYLDREVFIRNRKVLFNYIMNCYNEEFDNSKSVTLFRFNLINEQLKKHKLYFDEFDSDSVLFKLMFS